MRSRQAWVPALLFLMSTASAASAQDTMHEVQQPVVYGEDDRLDVADHPNAALRTLADNAVVTLMSRSAVAYRNGQFQFAGSTLGQSQDLCAGERFRDQPSAGSCSGTLIADDLVLTAGHCITNNASCRSTVIVFDYQWENGGLGPIGDDDVYNCRGVVARAESESPTLDYAVIQLDRPVTGRTPATVRDARGSLQAGAGITIIGSPWGLPQKIDDGGSVRDPNRGTVFVGTPDSFAGNSGSGIFRDGDLDLVGILISGEADEVADGNCYRVRVCAEDGCAGENMLYAGVALDAVCTEQPSAAVCGGASRCGDGFCAPDERGSCADCQPAVCGNGWCEAGEWEGCPDDCTVSVPAGWTCDPSYYGDQQGCDCNCGAYDIDCDAGQEVLNCGFGAVCNLDGTCGEGGGSEFCGVAQTPADHRSKALALLLALGGIFVARRLWSHA